MKFPSLVMVLLSCALLTAGCTREETVTTDTMLGGISTVDTASDAAVTATDTSTTTRPGADAVAVNLVDYRIEMPATLPAGETTFNITNSGEERHNFEIEGNGIERELEKDLGPGESGTLTVNLEPGTYKVYCPVANHEEEHGMTMQLTVQ